MYDDVVVDGNGLGMTWSFPLRLVPSRVSIGILLQGCFLVEKKSCDARAAKLLRDCDATDVEVSALVRDVVVVEFHCPVGCLA